MDLPKCGSFHQPHRTSNISITPSNALFHFASVAYDVFNPNAKLCALNRLISHYKLNPNARSFVPGFNHFHIHSHMRNVSLNPCAREFVPSNNPILFFAKTSITFSILNVGAEEFIPFSRSNPDNRTRYSTDAEFSRLGAVVATYFFLATFIIKSLVFFETHHNKVTPKNQIKNIKYNYLNNIVVWHLNIISIRNKFQCQKYIVGENIDILLISETKLNESFPDGQFIMDGFQVPFREDRDDKGGGLLLYVKEEMMKVVAYFYM